MTHSFAVLSASLLHRLLKRLLRRSDAFVARVLAVAIVAAKILGFQDERRLFIEEARALFLEGGSGADIARRMVNEGDPRRIRSIFRFLFL